MNLKELLQEKNQAEQQIETIKAVMAQIDGQIDALIREPLNQIRSVQAKDTGTVKIVHEGIEVIQNIPKKVNWDQDEIKAIVARIEFFGDDPRKYVSIKYDIPEREFNSFPDKVREVFLPARTVKPGKPQLQFKEVNHGA